MKKVALFAFNGDPVCFIHVLLNAREFTAKGWKTVIVMEGAATKLVETLNNPSSPLHNLYTQAKEEGLFAGVCEACAQKMGTRDSAVEQKLPLLSDLSGHPSIPGFIADGFEILTF